MKSDYLFPYLLDPLPKEELNELFIKYYDGDITAREEIILRNVKLVYKIVYTMFDSNLEELVSVGIEGLIKAVDTFDVSKDISFSTYATKCIENGIFKFLKRMSKNLNMSEVIDSDEYSLLDIVSDGNADFEEDYINCDADLYALRILYEAINRFNEKNKSIFIRYFGLDGKDPIKQSKLANMYGISQAQVSKVLRQAITRLKNEYDYYCQNNKLPDIKSNALKCKLNELLQKLGVSVLELSHYLGISRMTTYCYLPLDSLDKWPKKKKELLLEFLTVKGAKKEEIDNLSKTNEYSMMVTMVPYLKLEKKTK